MIRADDPNENISQTPIGDWKVNRDRTPITKAADNPLIIGKIFFDIF